MRASFLRLLPAALLLTCCAGCLPNATWLPDSTGFVYTGGKNKDTLYLYDLAKKAPRVLVEKGAGPAWPAVSPDGKRIAVVLRHGSDSGVNLEVLVFDRDGKELQHSEKMNWAKQQGGGDQLAAQAFWVPGRDQLLLSTDGTAGYYDLKAKSFTQLDVEVATFGDTPILPDGKGFLATKKDTDKPLVFVDWDGNEKEVAPTPADAFSNKGGDDPVPGMISFPMMHSSRWDGATALVRWNDVQIKVDPEKLTAAVEKLKPTLAGGKIIQDQLRLPGGAVVRAVELTKRYRSDQAPPDEPFFGSYRVELLKPGAKEPRVLMDKAGFFRLDRSPDGKRAVVRCSKSLEAIFSASNPGEDVLFVIGPDGDVADTIDVSK